MRITVVTLPVGEAIHLVGSVPPISEASTVN
jgi:hypothetical protein